MKKQRLFLLVFMVMLVLATGQPVTAAPPTQESDLPPAPIDNDEGGPTQLVGSLDYTGFGVPLS
jgi:hypothetical protein